jgi:predicted ATPase/DNA-binding CsgD family transcriptional regulator
VLDQCEHLADACAVLADALLRNCPGLRILATSRHVLGVAGEVSVVVGPLTVPDAVGPPAPEKLVGVEAVRLFADRAAAVLPGFALDRRNAAAVAAICRTLDGIPLALELAAVRLRSLSADQILSRLDSRFQLLSGGGPAGQPQHRTLQAALEWSYGLLTRAEQDMWRRVSVFAATFDLDSAEAVCAGGGITAASVIDLVDALLAKSILFRSPGTGKVRYRLLDTIGEFGLGKLRQHGDEWEFRGRHRAWYAALASRQEAFGPGRAAWIGALETDHQNVRAALDFCLSEPQEVQAGVEMACDLWRYWETHGHLTEGRRIMTAFLERLDPAAAGRARALWVTGFLALVQGDLVAARDALEAGLDAARRAEDGRSIARASSHLGAVMFYLGDEERWAALVESALTLHRRAADQVGLAVTLMQIGFVTLSAGDTQVAAGRFRECASVCESSGNVWYGTYAQWGIATVMWLGGEHHRAAAAVSAALRAFRDLDDPIGTAMCLDTLAWIAAGKGQAARAATLLGAASTAWSAIPLALPSGLTKHHADALAVARSALSDDAYRSAMRRGEAMNHAEAIGFALGEPSQPEPRPAGTGTGSSPGRLTRREQEVARLVADGHSNNQIAADLVISARTVESHIEHIMNKLGFSARAQIAAWSAASNPASDPPGVTDPGS